LTAPARPLTTREKAQGTGGRGVYASLCSLSKPNVFAVAGQFEIKKKKKTGASQHQKWRIASNYFTPKFQNA